MNGWLMLIFSFQTTHTRYILKPTAMPTISSLTFCPNEESIPTEIPSGPVMLARSNSLCILTKAVVADSTGKLSSIAPVALSYDGRAWEKAAGEFAMKLLYGQDFSDYANSGSQITLPGLNDSGKYYLTSYNRTISEADKVARLLETGTFGTMTKDLASFPTLTEATAKQWIIDQMNTNITSHREYFRKRANPRVRKHGSYFCPRCSSSPIETDLFRFHQLTNPVGIARNGHPCGVLSRWRNFAFSVKEGDSGVINPQRFEAKYNNLTDSYITIMLNGEFGCRCLACVLHV